METFNDAKSLTPPYVPLKPFKSCLEKISGLSLEEIPADLLMGYGLSKFNANATRQALQFLEIINEKGEVTDKFGLLRFTGEQYEENLRHIVEEAYKPLFTRLNIREASREDIFNMLIHTYGCSRRVATSATGFLVGMCEWAGIREAEKPHVRREVVRPKIRKAQETQRIPVIPKKKSLESPFSLVINLNIELDANVDKSVVTQLFRRIEEAWKETQEK